MNQQKILHATIFSILVALLIFVFSRINIQKAWDAFEDVKLGWIIFVVFLNLINTWIEANRWCLILRTVKKEIKVFRAFIAMLVGFTGNILLPFRLGDGARVYFISKKEKISFTSSLSTVVIDRGVDIIFFLMLVTIAAFFFSFPASIKKTSIIVAGVLISGITSVIFLERLNEKLNSKLLTKLKRWIEPLNHFKLVVANLYHSGSLFKIALFGSLSWLLKLIMVYAMFLAFHISLPFMAAAVVLIFVNLCTAVASTQANLGGFELSMVAALKLFSLDIELAMSYAITLHLVEIVPILISGLIVVWLTDFKLIKQEPAMILDNSEILEVNLYD